MVKEIYKNEKQLYEESVFSQVETEGTADLPGEPENTVQITESNRETTKKPGMLAKTLSSLYIDDAGIKLLVTGGTDVVGWAELPLESGLVNDGVIADPAVMAEKIKGFLQKNKIKSHKMIAGFSGLHCLSRIITLPPLNKALLNEAVQHEAERELPVPLENLYLSWQTIYSSEKELKIFLIAYTRNTVDALVQTLRLAGIKPYLMDLAPLAITRVVDRKTAAVADIRESGMDIVIMVDGVPEVIRSLPLPRGKSLPEKLPIIKDELQRTINFYNSGNSVKPVPDSLPVFLSGVLLDEPELYHTLSNQLGYAVQSPLPALKYPAAMVPAHYMVNIGLILKKLSLEGNAGISTINLNALPDIYRPKTMPIGKVLAASGAIITVGLIVTSAIFVSNMRNQTDSLGLELKNANQTFTQRLAAQKSLNDSIAGLEKKVSEATSTYQTFSGVQTDFSSQHDMINGGLELAAGSLGPAMTLISLTHSGDSLTVKGSAPDEAEVRNFASVLESSGRYSEVIISDVAERGISKVVKNGNEYQSVTKYVFDFTLILKIKR